MRRGKRGKIVLPVLLSAAVIIGGLFPASPLRDAVTGGRPAGVELVLSPFYVFLSPFSRVADTIGLLSIDQHVAVGLTVLALSLLAVIAFGRRAMVAGVVSLGLLLVIYACAIVFPRPMAALAVSDPDVMRVDFHSHTNASFDARRGFSPEANRAWHKRGGFDVAYISDHRSFNGAEAARSRNPEHARDGVVLLSAFEGRYLGTFEIFLGFTRADSATLMDGHRRLLEGRLLSGRIPASVVAMPSPLIDVQAEGRDNPPHIAAIELSDGGTRGLSQIDRDRAKIIRRADSLGLALVSGSNNHGWGYVIPAWTLVRVPGWRELAPDSLGAAIETAIRATPKAVRVVERRRPMPASPVAATMTVPVVIGQMLATLTPFERLVWLLWIWGVTLVVAIFARSRRGKSAKPARI